MLLYITLNIVIQFSLNYIYFIYELNLYYYSYYFKTVSLFLKNQVLSFPIYFGYKGNIPAWIWLDFCYEYVLSDFPLLHIFQFLSPSPVLTARFLFSNIVPAWFLLLSQYILINFDAFHLFSGIIPNKNICGYNSNFIFRMFWLF